MYFLLVEGCNNEELIGDGFCNDEVNREECNFDGGDCCGACILTDYCTNCTCLGNITYVAVPNALIGNDICNDELYTEECKNNGGWYLPDVKNNLFPS